MILLLCSLALAAATLAGGVGLLLAGLRAGDQLGDTLISGVGLDGNGNVGFTVENPGDQAVVIGASVRPRSLRLRCEAGSFVSVPRGTSSDAFLAGRHDVVCAISPGERELVLTPVPRGIGRRGELVVAIGEPERLRVVHRAVELAARYQPRAHAQAPARPPDPGSDALPLSRRPTRGPIS